MFGKLFLTPPLPFFSLCFPVFESPALQSTAGRGWSRPSSSGDSVTLSPLSHCHRCRVVPAVRGRGSPGPARPALGHRPPQPLGSLGRGSRRILQSKISAPRSQSLRRALVAPHTPGGATTLLPPLSPTPCCHHRGEGREEHGEEAAREMGNEILGQETGPEPSERSGFHLHPQGRAVTWGEASAP